MNCNVGSTERNIRLAGGLAVIGLGLFAPFNKAGRIAAVSIGAAEVITGLTRYCPVNHALGINTCKRGTLRQIGRSIGKIRAIV